MYSCESVLVLFCSLTFSALLLHARCRCLLFRTTAWTQDGLLAVYVRFERSLKEKCDVAHCHEGFYRASYASAVLGVVILSVRPSHKCTRAL